MQELVVNKRTHSYDVYIGRGSRWGNPFKIGEHGTRDQVVEMYRVYLWDSIKRSDELVDALVELEGKTLGCYCKPQACHGDVLLKAIQWAKAEQTMIQEGA